MPDLRRGLTCGLAVAAVQSTFLVAVLYPGVVGYAFMVVGLFAGIGAIEYSATRFGTMVATEARK